MARLQKVFTSADPGNGLCLSEISEPEDLSHPPHKQSGQPDVVFCTVCWTRRHTAADSM